MGTRGDGRERPALLLAVACAAAACGHAAEPREAAPLLSLRSTTNLDPTYVEGLAPALVFLGSDGDSVAMAERRGDFPTDFRLDVREPPPASAMLELSAARQKQLGLRGQVAEALIAFLPAFPPRTLPNEATYLISCDEAGTSCVRSTQTCIEESCRERGYDCAATRCEDLGTSGAEAPGQSYFIRGTACAGGACYQSLTACTGTGDCFGRYSRCPFERTTSALEWGIVQNCEVVDDWGSTGILSLSDARFFATTHYVTYVTEDNPGFNGLDLVRGYNVVESRLRSPEEYMESVQCSTRAEFDVLSEHNAANGTAYAAASPVPDEVSELIRERRNACPRATDARVLHDTVRAPLALELGPYPSL